MPGLPILTMPYTHMLHSLKPNVSQREGEIEWGHKEGRGRKWKLPFHEIQTCLGKVTTLSVIPSLSAPTYTIYIIDSTKHIVTTKVMKHSLALLMLLLSLTLLLLLLSSYKVLSNFISFALLSPKVIHLVT